nr:phage protein [uncultured Mediterranean phage uvMED]
MKHHNNLSDSQIHNPKGFAPARKRTVSTKNQQSAVEWVKANYTSTITITPIADVGGSLHHQYLCIYNSYDATKYAVYFQIINTNVMSTPTGYGGVIAVDVTNSGSGSTALEVGTSLQSALNNHADFTASRDGSGVVTVTGLTTASPALENGTGFGVSIADVEITNEVLHTDTNGNIKFTPFSTILSNTGVNDKNYVHTQSSASATWVVTHNLGKNASVTVVDSAGTVVIGQVDYDSINQITLTFSGAFSGKAYFN